MPFLELNFSTYEAALALQTSLNQQLSILGKYSKLFGSIICVKRRRRPPRKWIAKIGYYFHCFILIILSFLFITSVVIELIQMVATEFSCIKIILLITRIQSLFGFACVFTWFWNNGDIKLQEGILNSSNGIGIVKHRKRLILVNEGSVIYGFFRVAIYIPIYAYFQYLDQPAIIFPTIDDTDFSSIFNPIFLIILLFHFMAFPVFYSILSYSLLSILAEFDGLVDDFDSDENVAQLPVIRHYLFAHTQIIEVFHQFKTCFSNYFIGFFISSLFSAIFPTLFKGFQNYGLIQYTIFTLLICDHILVLIFVFTLSIKANEKVTAFSNRLLQLVSSSIALNEEIPSIVLGYGKLIKRTPKNAISIFAIQMFDRKFAFNVLTAFIFLLFLKFI